MNFSTVMETRKSCRAYLDKPVSRKDLLQIVEAGRLSPSGCNAQPWKFIVVDDPEAKARLCDALVLENGMCSAPWRDQVPAFIVLCEMPAGIKSYIQEHFGTSQRFAQGDIGGAAMNMCHQAMDLGLDTCMIGVFDQNKMEQAFGIPAGHEIRIILAIGYASPAQAVRLKARKLLDEVCSFNHC